MAWANLDLNFTTGMVDYLTRHVANYTRIGVCLDYLYSIATGTVLQYFPDGLKQIFDRRGIIGKDSYKPPAGTLSGPGYNVTIPIGAYWDGTAYYSKDSTTVLSMAGKSNGTYYINIDSAGNPAVSASADGSTVWQFTWTSPSISAVTRYASCAVLFDGDDYAECLSSDLYGDFESLAERIANLESFIAEMMGYYAYDSESTTGLAFYYKAGKVKDDNVVSETAAGHVDLANNDVSYIEVDPATGIVTDNITGFTSGSVPLFEVTTAGGEITDINDVRTWAGSTAGGGGGGHTQNTDTGTTSDDFKIDSDFASSGGAAGITVEGGSDDDGLLYFDRDEGKWKWSGDGGSTWTWIDEIDIASMIGAQELAKPVLLDDPPLVHEEVSRGSSVDWEDLDLSSYFTEAPNGVSGVFLRVVYWDTENPPSIAYFTGFRPKGATSNNVAYRIYSPAVRDDSRPQFLTVGVDTDGFLQFLVSASDVDTSNLRIYLLGYLARVTGVGTSELDFSNTGMSVGAGATVDFNVTGFVNRGLAHYVKVEETGGLLTDTYDLHLYDAASGGELLYKLEAINPGVDYEDWEPFWVKDADLERKVHIRIINNDVSHAGTFNITMKVEKFN